MFGQLERGVVRVRGRDRGGHVFPGDVGRQVERHREDRGDQGF